MDSLVAKTLSSFAKEDTRYWALNDNGNAVNSSPKTKTPRDIQTDGR